MFLPDQNLLEKLEMKPWEHLGSIIQRITHLGQQPGDVNKPTDMWDR